MRLLLITQNYTPEVAAAPIRLRNMVTALTEKGVEFEVLTALPSYPKGRIFDGYRKKFSCREEIDGVLVYRYWIYANNTYKALKRAISMFSFAVTLLFFGFKMKKIKSYDAVIIQTPPLFVACTASWLFKCVYKKKVILNVSDIHPQSLVEAEILSSESRVYKIMDKVERFIYKKADYLMGQSDEIIDHVKQFKIIDSFLYRTLQKPDGIVVLDNNREHHNKIVYAGLLGKTQDVLSIVQNVDFKKIGIEFHIYGDGGQKDEILNYCDNQNVFYHGSVPNDVMLKELQKYDASIVPLAKSLIGAVPSKIYNVVASGLPLIYMGKVDGEATKLVNRYKIGFSVPPGDYSALQEVLIQFGSLTNTEYQQMRNNCKDVSEGDFNFNRQVDNLFKWLQAM